MAKLHEPAFSKRIALPRTGKANFRAGVAGDIVHLRLAQYKIARGAGHLRTIEQDADVMHVGIHGGLFMSVLNRVFAGVMHFFTGLHRGRHSGCQMLKGLSHALVC